MSCRSTINNALAVGVVSAVSMMAGCSGAGTHATANTAKVTLRLEHVALNVPNAEAMAKWYCENLGLRVVREGPPPVNMHFIGDAAGHMMLEIYTNPPDAVPDYAAMDPLVLHVAFTVDDVKGVRERLLAAGATSAADVTVTPAGDELAMLRDPWGVPLQLVKRARPMLR